ncbi:MAG: hypothetical protein WCZ13_01640 [Acholeplasmataceae bacterium]
MVQKKNILEFIVILKSLEIDEINFNTLSRIHAQIECLDVDLLICYIKESDVGTQLKESLISLINTYYDFIDDKINDFDDSDARKYLSILRENALSIYKNNYANLLKLCNA